MGLLPCPNLPLWAAEKSFSSSDENHFPPPEKKKGLSLLQSPFPSKSLTNYAAVQARLATGHCCGSCSLGGNTCAKISATWTRCSKGLLRHDAVTTLDNFPNTCVEYFFFYCPRARVLRSPLQQQKVGQMLLIVLGEAAATSAAFWSASPQKEICFFFLGL